MAGFKHYPVLWREVLRLIQSKVNTSPFLVADCTLGGGAHTYSILQRFPEAYVVGVDVDQEAVARSVQNTQDFSSRMSAFHCSYTDLFDLPRFPGIFGPHKRFDVVLADCGMSSYQLEDSQRGFSYTLTGPLDMRFNQQVTPTAETVLNEASEFELQQILQVFGEETQAQTLAAAVVDARQQRRLTQTSDLAAVLRGKRLSIQALARCFQAFRMYVNQEQANLEKLLDKAYDQIEPGGMFLGISFHSIEHRIIQRAFQQWRLSGASKILSFKPTRQEIEENVRSRSAVLQAFLKRK